MSEPVVPLQMFLRCEISMEIMTGIRNYEPNTKLVFIIPHMATAREAWEYKSMIEKRWCQNFGGLTDVADEVLSNLSSEKTTIIDLTLKVLPKKTSLFAKVLSQDAYDVISKGEWTEVIDQPSLWIETHDRITQHPVFDILTGINSKSEP